MTAGEFRNDISPDVCKYCCDQNEQENRCVCEHPLTWLILWLNTFTGEGHKLRPHVWDTESDRWWHAVMQDSEVGHLNSCKGVRLTLFRKKWEDVMLNDPQYHPK